MPTLPPSRNTMTPAQRDIARGRQHFVTERSIRDMLPERLWGKHEKLWDELGTLQQGFIHVYGDIDVTLRGQTLNVSRTLNEQLLNRDDVPHYLALVNKPQRFKAGDPARPANRVQEVTLAARPRRPLDIRQDYTAAWGKLKEALVPQGIPALVNLTGVNSPAPWLQAPPAEFADHMQQLHQKTEGLKHPVTSHLARIEWLHAEYQRAQEQKPALKR